MGMIGILPQTSRFYIERLEEEEKLGSQCSFVYEETYKDTPKNRKAARYTVSRIRKAFSPLPYKLTHRNCTLRIEGKTNYQAICGMIAGEYLCWTRLAAMTFGDLLTIVATQPPR